MKLKLTSDFIDFYDEAFDKQGFEFRRITTDGPNRRQMFYEFKKLGLSTPLFGSYDDFVDIEYPWDGQVVIHEDENAHSGEGKILKKLEEFNLKDTTRFLVQYISPTKTLFCDYQGYSIRYLFIGNRCFKMEYISYEDWRSNYGDGDIVDFMEIVPCPLWRYNVYQPLFAVDFVGTQDNLMAIDFNVAPGLYQKEVIKYMSPAQIVLEIKDWFREWCKDEKR